MVSVETVPRIGGGGIKENGGEMCSSMIYFIYCKNFYKSSTTIKKNLSLGNLFFPKLMPLTGALYNILISMPLAWR
jgi:hypothetical protein